MVCPRVQLARVREARRVRARGLFGASRKLGRYSRYSAGFGSHLELAALDLLAPRQLALPVGVHEVPDEALEARLEDDARQGQQGELAVVPAGHAADVDVRVAGQLAELELLAPGARAGGQPVDEEARVLVAPEDLELVPAAVAEVPAERQQLRPAAQVVAQPQRPLGELELEEVVGAAVVGVEQEPAGLLGPELELEPGLGAGVPAGEARVAGRGAVEPEAPGGPRQRQDRQERRPGQEDPG